jgi:hypothetical protein
MCRIESCHLNQKCWRYSSAVINVLVARMDADISERQYIQNYNFVKGN